MTRCINNHRQDEARIVAACNRGKPNLARDEYGLAVTHDVRELVDMDLDFVLVVSTSYAHTEQVVAAAEAGLHLFCEKPITLTVKDADRMIEAVESAGVVNVVNYSMRFGYGAAMSFFLGVVSALISWVTFRLFGTERA